MNLDGTVIGDGGAEDAGIGSGMDAFEKDGSISGGQHVPGTEALEGAQGILGEIGSGAGMDSMESYEAGPGAEPGSTPLSGGEKAFHASDGGILPDDGFSGAGQGDTKVIPEAGAHEVNGIGYHGFDTPVQQTAQGNPGISPGMTSSESRKQEYRKITEERKSREVPKSRKDLKKKKKQNPKPKNGNSPM